MRGTNISRRAAQSANHFERLEARQLLSSTLQVGPTAPYHTIQSAVNAAHKGDTVLVAPGTYVEQVVVPSGLSNLTIPLQERIGLDDHPGPRRSDRQQCDRLR